ncbi:MAG TPA: GntG family PLP-dependent aldolase [Bryobacteraceae bacterium]|jgi:threonine aldolase|nr:GntG family PLP-dependent aldolase [Bryobacteraceae bacterium]
MLDSQSSDTFIDLRSDTVTKPDAQMRAAMAAADVGDDVYGEDPTVNLLEKRAAEIFGKEAALFVPTGTMGNTIAVKMHTRHGEEVICEARSHLMDWELSMLAWFSGCLARTIPTENGILNWDLISRHLRAKGPHNAPTTLIELENTHNIWGGTVYPLETLDEICTEAHTRGLQIHIDGARIFNAAAYLGAPVARIARDADSVMFCLSKALGAPVGSMVVGTKTDIDEARHYRKRLGGGMRQAGVLAAAGLIALEEGPAKLASDHENARFLAQRLSELPGISIDAAAVQTNIVIFDIEKTGYTPREFSQELKHRGVLANGVGAMRIRMVTHRDITRGQCERAMQIVSEVAGQHLAQQVTV